MADSIFPRAMSFLQSSLMARGYSALQAFFGTWFKLDYTSLAAALAIYSSASGVMKGAASKFYWWFTRFFTAAISVASHDRLNREILNWLGSQILTRESTRVLTAKTSSTRTDTWWNPKEKIRNDYLFEQRTPIEYLPTFGATWFVYERNIFMVKRINLRKSIPADDPDDYTAAPDGDEPLVVMVLGRSVKPIKNFFEMCRVFADDQRKAYVTVRASNTGYGSFAWDMTYLKPIRPLDTIHFDESTKQDLVDDITNYLKPSTRMFYSDRGIPFRRGYLLHGPPGTGKTSLSISLAGHFKLELYLFHIPSIQGDSALDQLFSSLPSRCIVLLEDIDAIGLARTGLMDDVPGKENDNDEEKDNDDEADGADDKVSYSHSQCTLSGLLNVIDGVTSQEGRIVLMTSNMAHKLDKALIRPGRIDKMIFLGKISPKSAELMFLRMHASENLKERSVIENLQKYAVEFSTHIPDNVFTPAELQGYLLNHRHDPARAAKEVAVWAAEEKAKIDEAKRLKKVAAAKKAKKIREKALSTIVKSLEETAARDDEDDDKAKVDSKKTAADENRLSEFPADEKITTEPAKVEDSKEPLVTAVEVKAAEEVGKAVDHDDSPKTTNGVTPEK